MQSDETSSDAPSSRCRCCTRRGLLIAVPALAVLAVMLPAVLRASYGILVVDQPLVDCRVVVVANQAASSYDEAARLLSEGVTSELLIVPMKPRRAEAIGAVRPAEQRAINELVARDVSPDRYRVIHTDAVTAHDIFRQLDAELSTLEGNCAVISTATSSRYWRTIIDQTLPPQRSERYQVSAVYFKPNEAESWYRERSGVRRVLLQGLRLMFVMIQGESEVDPSDPYEHLLREGKTS